MYVPGPRYLADRLQSTTIVSMSTVPPATKLAPVAGAGAAAAAAAASVLTFLDCRLRFAYGCLERALVTAFSHFLV